MRNDKVLLLAGLAGVFALMHNRMVAAGGVLSLDNVRELARQQIEVGDFNVDPEMLVRIAWIESHFDPSASRYEPHLGDASTGLTQTLLSTAQWLARDMGYSAYGVPNMKDLMSPQISLYFGASYLDYLSRHRGTQRSEQWIVRSYNGGPGNLNAATAKYWKKYLTAKSEVG